LYSALHLVFGDMLKHLSDFRLFAVAMSQMLIFTDKEAAHLEKCNECNEHWSEHIRDVVQDFREPHGAASLVRTKTLRKRKFDLTAGIT
jgi:hypothetical protein